MKTGAGAWTSVQPTNDIAGMLKKYGDRFCLMGGYNTNGRPGMEAATDDKVREEVERCMREYGFSPSYIFF